jgi:hypothetical protein
VAFNDPDVVSIATELRAHPDLRLLKIAAAAALLRQAPTPDEIVGLVGAVVYWDDVLGPVAQRIVTAAIRIGTSTARDDRVRKRGALLERIAFELVSKRVPHTYREHEIQLTHNPRSRRQWTEKKEVVADGPEFEVYECKSDGMPDIGDVDELSDISTTARAEGTPCRPTIVIFGTDQSVRIMARAWDMTETLYLVSTERILGLAHSSPSFVLRPAAAY